ncbi:hypothetical protein GA0111570_101242 [Raineyella antarctica]|uniref:Choice-of-anchor I domain-containing protein n=1 Tax=Raineyella antarctica TaxID=1577474 RepID=A0A1G6GD91_9ACTN|nr:choice-of-anchor I family protein [Raineyella antarctica]SDB79968.1 hypothetical protein GA0111570_101242 [Raineyella antarctica]
MFDAFTRRTPALLAAGAALSLAATGLALTPASAASSVPTPITYSAPDAALALSPVGTYATGMFEQSAAEIVQYHAATQRAFVVNAQSGAVDVLEVADPANPAKVATLDVRGLSSADGSHVSDAAVVNSVSIRPDGLGVAAVEADARTDNGWVVFFDANAEVPTLLGAVRVGALPDMLTFSPDGRYVLVANEGEPDGERILPNGAKTYAADPEGSVSVIEVPNTVGAPRQNKVRTADFHKFDTGVMQLPAGVRVFGPETDVANPISANLEPEYVTVSPDGKTAYVTLQEANAIAEVNVRSAQVRAIHPLGTKDWSRVAADVSDKDKKIDITTANHPVKSYYLPDAIASYQAGGQTYLVTANEGDSRDWEAYSEEERVKDVALCPAQFPNATALQDSAALGRLKITTSAGYDAAKGCFSELYGYGGRSFSIWTTAGEQVFDSGSQFEQITAAALPAYFNSDHAEAKFDNRSDDKGPEPEGVAIGQVGGRTYAFVALERVGGIMVYDVTDPAKAKFTTYVNNRDFTAEATTEAGATNAAAGDLGPEGLSFIPATDSPTGEPVVAVANEVSGSTTFFAIDQL